MKKLFTIDDFMVAFISATGCALGQEIPKLLGAPGWLSSLISMGAGAMMGELIGRIVFSKAVQKKAGNRIMVFAGIVLVFVLGQTILSKWTKVSLLEYLQEEQLSVIAMPILGFAYSMLVRWLRILKIRKNYGEGSKGFVYDLKQKDIDEVNRQNRPILGAYDAACAVKTRTGVFVGIKEKEISYFSGIPYAKPPVGERRWKAPEAPDESDAGQSEDCLTLNICFGNKNSDEKKTRKKKPVLVVFHHGDFSYGGSADPLIYGDHFAKAHPELVLVSFNYRLGVLGFIDFSEIPGGETCPDALNLGLLDQIAALKWIKENIAAFGGDPDKITVMGFESGAISISLLAACEAAKGLFRRAFVFFGSPESACVTPDLSRALAKKLLEETSTSTMQELMQLSTEQLKAAAQKLWRNTSVPTCDGRLIPADVYAAYQNGAASGVEFIIGIPSNEGSVYKSFIGGQNYEEFVNARYDGIVSFLDRPAAEAVCAYVAQQAEGMSELEAKAKVFEQWSALCMYRSALKLSSATARRRRCTAMCWMRICPSCSRVFLQSI